MQRFNLEISDPTLSQLGMEAIVDFYQTIAIDVLNVTPKITAFTTGIKSSPFLNVVIDTSSGGEINPLVIKSVQEFFLKHNVSWLWFVPGSKLDDNTMIKYQFELVEDAPGLYFDLSNDLPVDNVDRLSIKELDIGDDLGEWIKPLYDGFPSEDHESITNNRDDHQNFRKLNADLLNSGVATLRHFVAYYDNEIAGAATLFVSKHSVMLHNLAVKNQYKRRGIGKILGLHMMLIAKQLNYKHCFTDTSDDGFSLSKHKKHKNKGFEIYSITKVYKIK